MDSAQLVICSRLDNFVHSDGNRSVARLAKCWTDSRSHANLSAAIVAQRCVVGGIFSPAISGPSLCRDRHFVVRHPGDIDRILESSACRRLVAHAVFDLGQLRDSPQLFNLAAERLTIFITTIGTPY